MTKKICSVKDCSRPSRCWGLCSMHFQRARKWGDPLFRTKQAKFETLVCSIADCEKPHKAKGFCSLHYQRFKRFGDPLKLITRERGTGTIVPDGYLKITLENGTRIFEHRHVMEQHLGRKLQRKEIVHHINGNRRDNSIENLELIQNQSIHVKRSPNSLKNFQEGRKLRWSKQ